MNRIGSWEKWPVAVCASVVVVASSASQADPVGVKLSGTRRSLIEPTNSGAGWIPPDTMGAIGGGTSPGALQFAEFTNGSFTVYNPTNGSLLAPRKYLDQFFLDAGITGLAPGGVGGGSLDEVSDPHIWYD